MTRAIAPRRLLTAYDAAELLGISRVHVTRLANAGKIAVYAVAGRRSQIFLFTSAEVERVRRLRADDYEVYRSPSGSSMDFRSIKVVGRKRKPLRDDPGIPTNFLGIYP